MLKDGHDLPLRRVVAGKLVGVMTRGGRICFFCSLRSSRLAACLSRRRWALDQNVEDDAGLVYGSPQPMLHPGNFERDLIKMPFVANPGKAATDLVGEMLTELAHCRTVSWVTMMPRAASNSSTMRSPSGKRKYSQTAWPMISAGNPGWRDRRDDRVCM